MCKWSFLTNHATVLSQVARQPGSTVREIASVTGVSDRALSRIIADLVNTGYITKKREGREFGYSINPGLELLQDTERGASLRDFLEALGWQID